MEVNVKKIIVLLVSVMAVFAVSAKEVTVGRTWDIVEPDPIAEAQKRAESVSPERLKPKSTFRTRLAAKSIFRTITPKNRTFTPMHTLEKQVVDKNGNVIYPSGFKFNPIKYMKRYKSRIVIIDQKDAPIVKAFLKPSDIVIVNEGDLTETAQLLNHRVSMLDILTAESMDIQRIPVVVTVNYDNYYYNLEEFLPEQGMPKL